MPASIVSVGSEILRGTLLDTNSNYFAQELQAIGIQVVRATQVADDLDAIVEVLHASIESADLVVISGGLGPTEDDLTREAILELTGESPVVDSSIVEEIRERFHLRGAEMPLRNEKQAWKIPSAMIISNDHGTAPGWLVELPSAIIVTLPGPPRENRPMWRDLIRPQLISRLPTKAIVTRTIKTIGIGESSVADRLQKLIADEWPVVATYAKDDGVQVTVTASHTERAKADAAVQRTLGSAVQRLGNHVYGFDDDSLAVAITQPLTAAGINVAVWEAGTAGAFAQLLLADTQAMHFVSGARIWSSPSAYRVDEPFRIDEFASDAARSSEVGAATVVAVHFGTGDTDFVDGTIDVGFTRAGSTITRSQQVRGTLHEVRRRSALFAAEVL